LWLTVTALTGLTASTSTKPVPGNSVLKRLGTID
jgi:hypothetical protein